MKKISVLMTVYNAQNMLKKSLQGIINQTYTNIEFVIVNDGSSDKSAEIINDYACIDKRIKFINRKENKGRVYSLNEGLAYCTGDWIAINDADDISNIYRLEKMVNFIICNKISDKFGVVGCASCIKNIVENKEKKYYITYGNWGHKRVSKFRIFYSMPFIHSSFLYNIDALHKVGGFAKEVTASIDYFTLLKISNIYPIYALNEILVDRYIDGNNFFLKEKMIFQGESNLLIINKWAKENYKNYYIYNYAKQIINIVKHKN